MFKFLGIFVALLLVVFYFVIEVSAFYTHPCFWGITVAAVVYYFCFVPSRTKFSPRTTGIAEPLNDAGQVDYFAEFEKTLYRSAFAAGK